MAFLTRLHLSSNLILTVFLLLGKLPWIHSEESFGDSSGITLPPEANVTVEALKNLGLLHQGDPLTIGVGGESGTVIAIGGPIQYNNSRQKTTFVENQSESSKTLATTTPKTTCSNAPTPTKTVLS